MQDLSQAIVELSCVTDDTCVCVCVRAWGIPTGGWRCGVVVSGVRSGVATLRTAIHLLLVTQVLTGGGLVVGG